MSAVATARRSADPERRPGLARLTRVELRKAVDTRAGFWLLAAIALLVVGVVVVIAIAGHDEDRTLTKMVQAAVFPPAILLPVVGILLVTSEWSQRTTLITFALVPQRSRVVLAKLTAGMVLAIVASVLSLGVALAGVAIAGPDLAGRWSLSATALGQAALFVLLSVLIGAAFGAAILSSAPAIVLYFVLPIAYTFIGAIPGLEGFVDWTDQNQTLSALAEHELSGTEWARAGTTLLLWLVVPLAIGLWRILRNDAR
jgi:ABC-2 type transport system permease protein